MTVGSLFEKYNLKSGHLDEMFRSQNKIHSFCHDFFQEIRKIPQDVFKNLQASTNRFFYDYGVIFDDSNQMNQSQGLYSMDCIPRIMNYSEWDFIKKGLEQRIIAINLFLKDIYHKGFIVKDNIIPKDVIYNCVNFYERMKEVHVPGDVYVSVYNANVARVRDRFFVLEDNVRTSPGSAYVIACRQAMMKNFFSIIRRCKVQSIESYYLKLLKNFYKLSKKDEGSKVVLLTPNNIKVSYFEYVFLAYQMGIDLVQAQDLLVQEGLVYVKTTKGFKRVDIIYNVLDDIFDPSLFKSDSFLGIKGLFHAYKSGQVCLFNAPGSELVEDKIVYSYIPHIIKYYLNQDPILFNLDTFLCRKEKHREYTLDNLSKLIVRSLDEFEEKEVLIGPLASQKEIRDFTEKIKSNSKNYISQPVLPVSTSPCYIKDEIKPGYTENYFFGLYNNEMDLIPGGLCYTFSKEGQLFTNSHINKKNVKDIWLTNPSNRR